MSAAKGALAVGTVPALLLAFLLVGGGVNSECAPQQAGGRGVAPGSVPGESVAGWDSAQLEIAATIMLAGSDMGMSARDQTIGVMVAMGESSLTNIAFGDYETSGYIDPNTGLPTTSLGIFQQQEHYGPAEVRMDPYKASEMFFRDLQAVAGRDEMAPSSVGHEVQVNLVEDYYEPFWPQALEVVEALGGVSASAQGAPRQTVQCEEGQQAGGSVAPGSGAWVIPATGPIEDPYGMRFHPLYDEWRMHNGLDLNTDGCGGPIWAASDGVVSNWRFDDAGNGRLMIDHADGVQTEYWHIESGGTLVNVGDAVTAGQQVAMIGTSGQSTGCHLHFQVYINGELTDPAPFLADRGASF